MLFVVSFPRRAIYKPAKQDDATTGMFEFVEGIPIKPPKEAKKVTGAEEEHSSSFDVDLSDLSDIDDNDMRAAGLIVDLPKRNNGVDEESSTEETEGFIRDIESDVRMLLNENNIKIATWVLALDNIHIQVTFTTQDALAEIIFAALKGMSIGVDFGSVSVGPQEMSALPALNEIEADEEDDFVRSIKTRISVNAMLENTENGSKLTFDYMMMVVIASVLAGVGLATNSAVVVVASMLVSPIMGPILAITLGIVVDNRTLIKQGLLTELAGLGTCLLSGFVLSILAPAVPDWPTEEMASRGQWSSILFGMIIAFFSGLGVALSVASKNISGLVGVAISASLLPPAVNCGMQIGVAIVYQGFGAHFVEKRGYYLEIGFISFFLTIVNILFVIMAGVIMFKIKEVAPIKDKSALWQHQLADLRQYHYKARGEGIDETILPKFGSRGARSLNQIGDSFGVSKPSTPGSAPPPPEVADDADLKLVHDVHGGSFYTISKTSAWAARSRENVKRRREELAAGN